MSYRLLLDENIEHEVLHRLENAGHDVEHVDFIARLGKGTSDDEIARYSLDADRTIVTYDDDFIEDVPSSGIFLRKRYHVCKGGCEHRSYDVKRLSSRGRVWLAEDRTRMALSTTVVQFQFLSSR